MQRSFLISYDLRGKRNYEALYTAIKALGVWGRVNESVWLVKAASSTLAIYTALNQHLDGDDRIFVVTLNREANWRNTLCSTEWLQTTL